MIQIEETQRAYDAGWRDAEAAYERLARTARACRKALGAAALCASVASVLAIWGWAR